MSRKLFEVAGPFANSIARFTLSYQRGYPVPTEGISAANPPDARIKDPFVLQFQYQFALPSVEQLVRRLASRRRQLDG